MKPYAMHGDLTKGRTDTFLVNRPFEDLRREMRATGWQERNATLFSQFAPVPGTHGYNMVLVTVLSFVLDGSKPKGWCEIDVARRIPPLSITEVENGIAAAQRNREVVRRLEVIKNRIKGRRRLANADRKFAFQMAGDKTDRAFMCRAYGLVTLEYALRAKLVARKEVLAVVESNIDWPRASEARFWLLNLQTLLSLGLRSDPDLRREAAEFGHRPIAPTTLNELERSFITRCFATDQDQNAILATDVFVPKQGLDSGTVKWLQDQVARRVRGSRGDVRLYWQCVDRVLQHRNREKPPR
ncbi:MAG: hypothetical protein ACYC96_07540 [Fimbriimonadaceae bacterium]